MSTIKYQLISLTILASASCIMQSNAVAAEAVTANTKIETIRLQHARELLGKNFHKKTSASVSASRVSSSNNIVDFTRIAVKRFLPKAQKKDAAKISNAIVSAAEKYELDPVFLVAMIQNESSFRSDLKGSVGEIGLMQIRPDTAQWIAKLYKLKYTGSRSLYDPVTNIQLGAAFLDKLRKQFDSHSHLYVSAYNIGAKKVRDLVSNHISPKDYVQAVMKRYLAIYDGFKGEQTSAKQAEIAWINLKNITARQ